MSIVKEGNTDLDEYKEIIKDNNYYAIEIINGHFYTRYPIGVSIIAAPFVFIIDKGLNLMFTIFPRTEEGIKEYIRNRGHPPPNVINVITLSAKIELFVASIVVGLTAVFIYLISYLFLDRKYSLLVTFIFAFCTSTWSTASRALWQHGPSMLMLTITLYLFILAKNKPRLIQFSSIPLAFSYVVRPTNSIPVFLLTMFVLIQYRQYFLRYVFWAMTIAVPFLLFNFTIYHSLLSSYYMPKKFVTKPHYFEAVVGHLISPGRGLFVFTPIFLFSIYGVILKIKNSKIHKLDCFLLSIIVLHWVLISFNPNWWGGHSIGPRLFSDMIPYFIYFLIPGVEVMSKLRDMRKVIFVILYCFIIISFLIHFRGATSYDVFNWNSVPVDVDLKPSRVWDWHDLQFLRGLD